MIKCSVYVVLCLILHVLARYQSSLQIHSGEFLSAYILTKTYFLSTFLIRNFSVTHPGHATGYLSTNSQDKKQVSSSWDHQCGESNEFQRNYYLTKCICPTYCINLFFINNHHWIIVNGITRGYICVLWGGMRVT